MPNHEIEYPSTPQGVDAPPSRALLITLCALILTVTIMTGAIAGYWAAKSAAAVVILVLAAGLLIPLAAYVIYRNVILPYYRRLEDANLELRIRQEELFDTKDDLFIKFLGIYDVNYAANSPRLFEERLRDAADITARVMDADACLIYLYDKAKDDLALAAANEKFPSSARNVRIALGTGICGWSARRLEPVMLRDMKADSRFQRVPGLPMEEYTAIYCLPLYVYSSGTLMGVMEALYTKGRTFTDEEINFFTTLAGILSNTIHNERLQSELRKMNTELEQWVAEKTEELGASEERYRTLVENACESIFVVAENGDIVFANQQAARLTGHAKFDLIHKNLIELFAEPGDMSGILRETAEGRQSMRSGVLNRADGAVVPVDVISVGLVLMGRRFLQVVVRDMTSQARLDRLLEETQKELEALKGKGAS